VRAASWPCLHSGWQTSRYGYLFPIIPMLYINTKIFFHSETCSVKFSFFLVWDCHNLVFHDKTFLNFYVFCSFNKKIII
jgi:hypothetical protein